MRSAFVTFALALAFVTPAIAQEPAASRVTPVDIRLLDGRVLVALSIDENERDARVSARSHGHRVPVAMRSDAVFEHYGRVEQTPVYLIIDRSGTVRERVAGPVATAKLQSKIAALLAEPPPVRLSER